MADRYASLKQGLVGCWIPSVSGSGLLLPDLSGRGNNGSLVGMDASDWVSASYGRALDFDGVNDYVDAGDCCDFTSGFMTISAWIKRNETTTAERMIVTKFGRSSGVDSEDGFIFRVYENKLQWAPVLNAATHTFSTSADFNTTDLVHVAVIVETNNGASARLYRNGIVQTASWTLLTGNVTLENNAYSLRLGNYRYAGVDYGQFSGLMDDVRIYSRGLTESEIRLLASEPGIGFKRISSSAFATRYAYKPAKPRNYSVIRNRDPNYSTLRQGLVAAYCPSISGQGNVLPDLVGGNHGTLTNMGPDDWVSGQYGRALDFDGTNDYVQSSLGYYGTGSISFWVKANAEPGIGVSFGRTASSTEVFGVAVGQNITGTLTDELITVFTIVGTARIEGYTTATRTELFDNNWHNVTVVQRTANTSYEIYLDGARKTTTVGDATLTSFGIGTPSADLVQFGTRRSSATQGVFLNGQLDDIRLYSRALSPNEIRLLSSRPGIGLRQDRDRNTFYQFPSGARRKRILTGMP